MKKTIVFMMVSLGLAACDPSVDNAEDLNSIPEEAGNVAPEV
jgi:hypothetical protein